LSIESIFMSALPQLAEPADGKAACFHCGLPVPFGAQYPIRLKQETHPACCRGCQAVAQTIIDAGQAEYYRHRTALPATPESALEELKELGLYDFPEVQASFVKCEGDIREAFLILEGIVCAACVWLNERHLRQLPGVLEVEVNYSNNRARVRWDESRAHLSDILKAVREIGYIAHPFDPGRSQELYRKERNAHIRRIAIAGLGMMQVMMFAIPGYIAAGTGTMASGIEAMMRWASLLLTVPVVFYSAWPFFRGAWRDLRRRYVGMDVPVALGIGISFSASVWATLTRSGEVYFDSVVMFVFFLLTGRFLEFSARRKSSEVAEALVKLLPAVANKLPNWPRREQESVPVSMLGKADHVLIRPGESIPADGVVVEGESSVNESLLTGESKPLSKGKGETLVGGAINVESTLIMQVERVGQDTVLSGIIRLLDRASAEKPRMAQIADRVAGWFVGTVLLIAALSYMVWWHIDAGRALWVMVSVLVVTCPCALSLATPAALTVASGRLLRQGLLATRGHALETLSRVTHFIFDKTGTLTYGQFSILDIRTVGGESRERCLALAAALEQGSEHPMALAFQAAGTGPALAVKDLRNVPGKGIEGNIAGRLYRLGSMAFVSELSGTSLIDFDFPDQTTVVALGDETGCLALFALGDRIRPDAEALVRRIRERGIEVWMLSGDAPESVKKMADRLGITLACSRLSPGDKLDKLQALQKQGARVAMMGDGVNDAPVLAAADVSIAMGQGTAVAQSAADLLLLTERLETVADALEISRGTRAVIRQNLAWALIYNTIAIPAAFMGWVTPWMAGIGMSMSSLFVVLNALRLSRTK
jgi:P-type Cu2+ transporter